MTGPELLVAGWFATPVIKLVFDKAQKFLSGNYELQKNTTKMIQELTRTLLLCEATVIEVQKKKIINNHALTNWLTMLKETVYDAEDVLDNMEAQSIKEEVQGKKKVSEFDFPSLDTALNMIVTPDNLKSLKMVLDQLNKLSTDIDKFVGLVTMNENNESLPREGNVPRESISQPVGKVNFYSRQDELNQILNIILDSESEPTKMGAQVIPILGMGGVGKTALAQAVYNKTEVEKTFEKRAWLSVSNKPDVDAKSVLRKLYQSLGNSTPDSITFDNIFMNINSCIGGVGKFLIVLDDLFDINENEWEYLDETLSHCAPGSVVLITTQNQAFANRVVANTVGAIGPIALSTLNSGIFWKLFECFAFGNEMPPEKRKTLQPIGKKIAEKLRGLPLAAKIIGNKLRTNADEKEWKKILKSEWWEGDIPEGKSSILPSIGLGYNQLDPCLRQCFAYCSVFPRNSLIEKDRLVHMWIAQNFIQSDVRGGKTLEDIGRQWFDKLVEKSFFQRAGDNNSYVMHDLMHDLAVIVSSGECFYLREVLDKIPLGVRHLTIDIHNLNVMNTIKTPKNLRSFFYFNGGQVEGKYSAIKNTLSNLVSIRVLDLSHMCMENELEPPTAIWILKHLRFLDLSSTGIKVLTHFSIDHCHLQALYIRKCESLKLPSNIHKLINLRHLCADEKTIAQISGIGQLTNLQELGVFVVGNKEGHKITELGNLREIRGTLRIKNFENIKNKDEAKLANLVDKEHLDSICISSSTPSRESNVDLEVLQELQPHKYIKDLRIDSYAGLVFPNWIIQIRYFEDLNTLYLTSCVNVEVLPPLGELPDLKFLHIEKLSSVKFINNILYGKKETVFPLLEELVLGTLSNCEKWITDDAQGRTFFPCLSKLTIINNKKLSDAPLHLFSSSLIELTIRGCPYLILPENSIPRLPSLTRLELCANYEANITFDPLNIPLLDDLNLTDCSELKIKGDLRSLSYLKRLKLVTCSKLFSCYSIKDQQSGQGLQVHQNEGLRSLSYLKRTKLVTCSKLFSSYSIKDQQSGQGLQVHQNEGLRSLTHIEADQSLLHHEYHQILGNLPSLRVMNFSNITQLTNHQDLWFKELTALQEIYFSNCEFEHLPASLTLLSSLKKMELSSCTKVRFNSDSMPPNLQELILFSCSENLVQRCQSLEHRALLLLKGKIQLSTSSSIPVFHIDEKGQIPDAHELQSMALHKPISDAIGRQACASCFKTFKLRDLVLYDWGEKLRSK